MGPGRAPLAELGRPAGQGLKALAALLLPPLVALAHRPQITVDATLSARLARGQTVTVGVTGQDGEVAVVNEQRILLGIGRLDKAGHLAPKRWLVSSN